MLYQLIQVRHSERDSTISTQICFTLRTISFFIFKPINTKQIETDTAIT